MSNTFKSSFISKQVFKHRAKECYICHEDDYDLLDTHRIIAGGKYSNDNCVCLCVACHRKHHKGKMNIIGWFNSTAGRLLHFEDEDGNEQFI